MKVIYKNERLQFIESKDNAQVDYTGVSNFKFSPLIYNNCTMFENTCNLRWRGHEKVCNVCDHAFAVNTITHSKGNIYLCIYFKIFAIKHIIDVIR